MSENIRGTIDMHALASIAHGKTMGMSSDEHNESRMMGRMDRPAI